MKRAKSIPAVENNAVPRLVIEYWPIARLQPYIGNPRKNDKAVERMVASIREYGFAVPVLARNSGEVIDGHLRLKGGAKLGMLEIPVIPCDGWSDAQVRAFRLMANRSVGWAEWDVDLLAAEFAGLKDLKFDLSLTGFDSREIDGYTLQPNAAEDDVPPVPETPTSRREDLWLISAHRLLCGDATSAEDVQRATAHAKIALVFTDPPYGINVVRNGTIGGDEPFGKNGFDGKVKAGVYPPVIGDDSVETALKAFETARLIHAKTILMWGGNYYAHRLPATSCWVIWDKETDGNFGDGEIAYCTAHKSVRIFRHKWSGMLKASERGEKRVHPTQKPVALARWAFIEFSKPGDVVMDGFLGSGSTLVAAELTGRVCFGLEIDPAYCDVIVSRWQNLTGKHATLDGDGRTFAEIKAARAKVAA